MRRVGVIMCGLAGLLAVGCSDDETKVPTRDELAAQIVEQGGVDQATAECTADALFDTLSEDDIAKLSKGEEPSAAAQEDFTNAVLDCLMPTATT